MKPIEVLRALSYPLTETAVLVPLLSFCLLFTLARWAGLLGLYLMIVLIPAVFRYQVIVLEARARGACPATPDSEFFRWIGNAWTLFPALLVLLLIWAALAVDQRFGSAWATLPLLFGSVFFPASIAVLAITQSPLQSINPVAIYRLLEKCGDRLWIATAYLLLAAWVWTLADALPGILAVCVQLYLSFAFFSLTGSLIHAQGLIDDVDIPAPPQKSAAELEDDVEKARTHDLNHAYGFISRDNRAGGFRHLFARIAAETDVVGAWAWYFERMLAWENLDHALFFAQHYVHDMLVHGEKVPAVKVMLRCRMINEAWRPFREDLAAAVEAAESSGNIELAAVLKRG